jgi:putative ABC transport system permease protein
MAQWMLALRLARRELRGGLKGFRIFLACLMLGVTVIAAVGSISASVRTGIAKNAREILGGDIELRLLYQPASAEQRNYFAANAVVSDSREMRAMARPGDGDQRTLVELKAIDAAYPLYGKVDLDPQMTLEDALRIQDGVWGAVADANLLARLGLKVGDTIAVGDGSFEIRAAIVREPDRGAGIFILGPRLMIADGALESTGLVQPGSLIYHLYRLRLPDGGDGKSWVERLRARFPEAIWRIRQLDDAAAGIRRFVDNTALYLTLVGLAALLVGGVGVGNAVRAYLDGKTGAIATLKCVGATRALVLRVYLLLIILLALGGIAIGLVIGAAVPLTVAGLLAERMAVPPEIAVHPTPLLLAAAFGLLTAVGFSLWPLFRARNIRSARLFRHLVDQSRHRPRPMEVAAIAAVAVGLAGLVIASAGDRWLAAGFVAGAIVAMLAFRAAGQGIVTAARRLSQGGRGLPTGPRLALANLCRPGAPTGSIVLSLGLGLTVLVAVALVQGNLTREIRDTLPETAPSFFFIDIQADQVAEFDRLVGGYDGVSDLERVPMLRGRITAMNGVSADQWQAKGDMGWVLQGDRGITWSDVVPRGSRITAGEWWPTDYRGAPLISLDAEVAAAFGLKLGDTITVNVLGREITGTLASFREFEWSTLTINFVMVFSPGILDGAPQTHLATARIAESEELALQKTVADRFANVSAIRVKDALEAVNRILAAVGDAVRLSAGVTLLAGLLVLGGAVIAGHHRRVHDAVIMKVLGATRGDVARAYLLEFGLLGVVAGVLAAVLGTLGGYLILTQVMDSEWRFLPGVVLWIALAGAALTLAFGLVGTWRALGQPSAPLLRNE